MPRRNIHIPQTKRGTKRIPSQPAPVVTTRQMSGEVRRELGLVPGLVRTVETIEHEKQVDADWEAQNGWIRNDLLS